jgi:hypothetical protein
VFPLLETGFEFGIPHAIVAGGHETARAFVAGSAESVANLRSLSKLASQWRQTRY